MADRARLTATEYLDRMFDVIREEAAANPEFAARLVNATGGEVVFPATLRATLLNPVALAAQGGEASLRAACAEMSVTDLRKVLKDSGLATPIDVKAKDQTDLLDMLVQRALARASSRSS